MQQDFMAGRVSNFSPRTSSGRLSRVDCMVLRLGVQSGSVARLVWTFKIWSYAKMCRRMFICSVLDVTYGFLVLILLFHYFESASDVFINVFQAVDKIDLFSG